MATVWVCRDTLSIYVADRQPYWQDGEWCPRYRNWLHLPPGFCDLKISEAVEVELVPTGKKIVAKEED